MKRVVIFLACLFGTTCIAGGPKLMCKDTLVENVYTGLLRTFELEVSNAGDEVLVINDVKTSCGCTVPNKRKYRIEPRKKETVIIGYKSRILEGAFNHRVLLISNDSKQPEKLVILKGNILRSDFTTSARELSLTKIVGVGANPSEKIDISSSPKIVFLEAKLTGEDFMLLPVKQSEPNSFSITIKAKAGSKPGVFNDILSVRFLKEKKEVLVELPVKYEVKPEFSVYPPKILLPYATNNMYSRLLLKSENENKHISIDKTSIHGLQGLTTKYKRIDDYNYFIYVSGKYETLTSSPVLVIELLNNIAVKVPLIKNLD